MHYVSFDINEEMIDFWELPITDSCTNGYQNLVKLI